MTTPITLHGSAPVAGQTFSTTQLWAGRILSGIVTLFLLWDGVMKLLKPAFVIKANREIGYPESDIVGIGVVLLVCTLLYVLPRTSILGALLLTGYLGGAIASQVRAGQPLFNWIFAFVMACLVWGGLWLRDFRARNLLRVQS
jgi:hypothetical protein